MPPRLITLASCGAWLTVACSGATSVPAHPGPLAADNVPRYDLTVRLDPDSARLEATGTILLAAVDSPTVSVPMVLARSMGRLRMEVVEPTALAGPVTVDSVGTSGRDVRWLVRLPRALPAGTPLRLRFAYTGGERTPGFLFHITGDVVYASGWGTNWYPGLGDGTIRGVGRMRVQTPSSHPTVLASGTRRVDDGPEGWHTFETVRPIYFSIVAGRFHVTRHDGPIPVTVYALEARPNAAEQAATSARAIEVLQREFGPYRFGEMALVEYPDSLTPRMGFNSASEPGMLVLKAGYLRGPPSLGNYGHELGHNWWPHVTNFRPAHALMVEGMANYAAFRVVEAIGGAAAGERFRRSGDPGFNGDINALSYLMNAAAGFDTTLLEFRAGTFPRQNMGGVKGAFVIDMLAQEVGRSRFRREMTRILATHEGKAISWEEFVAEMERGAGRELGWFSEQWTRRTGVPEWRIDWTQEGGTLRGVVTQDPPYYRATLPIQATSADAGSRVRSVVVDGPRTEFTWRLPFQVERMEIDPRYRMLWWAPGYRARATALAPVTAAYVRKSLDELRQALAKVPEPDTHGYEFLAHLSLARLLFDQNQPDSVIVHARAALAAPTRDPELVSLAYAQLALVARARGDVETLRWAVAGAIAADEAADVAGASVWARGLAPP